MPPAMSSTAVVVLPAPLPPPSRTVHPWSATAAAWSRSASRSARMTSTVMPVVSVDRGVHAHVTGDLATVLGHCDPVVIPDVVAVIRRRGGWRVGAEYGRDDVGHLRIVAPHLDGHAESVEGPAGRWRRRWRMARRPERGIDRRRFFGGEFGEHLFESPQVRFDLGRVGPEQCGQLLGGVAVAGEVLTVVEHERPDVVDPRRGRRCAG